MENIDQETLLRASYLEQQSQIIENSINFIQTQIKELESFSNNLNELNREKPKETLSNLGRGVYIKTNIENQELFVEVGAGVVVKKTLPQTIEVIQGQINKFKEAKEIYLNKQEENTNELMQIIEQMEKKPKNPQNS